MAGAQSDVGIPPAVRTANLSLRAREYLAVANCAFPKQNLYSPSSSVTGSDHCRPGGHPALTRNALGRPFLLAFYLQSEGALTVYCSLKLSFGGLKVDIDVLS